MALRDDTGLSRWERCALGIVGLVLVVLTVVVVDRVGSPEGNPVGSPDNRPTLAPAVERPVSVVDGLGIATDWAEEWNEDAWLILVSAQLEMSGEEPDATPIASHGSIVFTFAAPRQGDEWPRLSIVVSRASGTIFHEDEQLSSVEPPPPFEVDLADLPVPAEQAFRIAEQLTGREYREGCEPSRRQVQVALDSTDRNQLTWVVVYYDQRERGVNDIVARINATTGEVSIEEKDDVACNTGR